MTLQDMKDAVPHVEIYLLSPKYQIFSEEVLKTFLLYPLLCGHANSSASGTFGCRINLRSVTMQSLTEVHPCISIKSGGLEGLKTVFRTAELLCCGLLCQFLEKSCCAIHVCYTSVKATRALLVKKLEPYSESIFFFAGAMYVDLPYFFGYFLL